MNRQPTREEISKLLQRWQQLKQQYGDQAINVPEFAHLSKVIKLLQQNQQNLQRQQAQAGGASGPIQGSQAPVQQLNTPHSANAQINRQPPNSQYSTQSQVPLQGNMMTNSNNGTPNTANANLMQPKVNSIPNNGMNSNGQAPTPSQYQAQLQQGQQTMGFQNLPALNTTQPASKPSESAFTTQQFQLVKSQFQALKYLLKSPGQGNPPIPQNLNEFVTNDRSAFPSGSYLPGVNSQQANISPQQAATPQQIPTPQQVPAQQVPNQPSQNSMGMQPSQNLMGMQPHLQTKSNSIPGSGSESPQLQLGLDMKNAKRAPKPKTSLVSQATLPTTINGNEADVKTEGPEIEVNTVKPIVSAEKVPIKLEMVVPDRTKTEKVIIPIRKPDIHVDCFEIPDLFGSNAKDIAFNALYTPQSRLQFPGLLPKGINMAEIYNNKEVFMVLQVEQEIDSLKQRLNTLDQHDAERLEIEAQLAKLQLITYQKQLRGHVLSQTWFSKSLLPNSHPNFLAKFNTLSLENVSTTHDLYRRQLETLLQAQNQKHQQTINEILTFKERKTTQNYRKREKINKFTAKINSFHNQIAREEQKRIERMAKQRLAALKSNDEEAYLKLLDHTKDTRITHLLKQTNQFLDTLAQAVQSQQQEAQNGPKSKEAPVNEEERREKIDYYHVAHRIKEEVTQQPSILVGGTLKEYQIKGLQWMVSLYNNHLNGILADEMGLGKTIQTISLITYLIETKQKNGPFIVIVPLSTLTNWNLEFEKWAPSVKKITYKGTPVQRKVMQQDIRVGNFQVLLTTFEYVIKDKQLLSRIKWAHMIIDEGHRMKNANSKLSETLTHSYHTDYRLILTGTPLQNNLPELWALLNFVLPKIFNSVKSFDEWFNTPFSNTGSQDKIGLSEEETLLIIRRLHKVLRPFLLRRLKKDVEKDLPNKVEKVVKCKMSSLQSKLYQQMLKYNVLYASQSYTSEEPVIIKNANNQIMQLRKICNHPFVYEEVENLINPTVETNDQIWRVAGKFELLEKVLIKFKRTGHRVLIFFQMTQIMDIMEDFLRLRNLKYMRLDGGTKSDDRTGLLKLFNAPNSDYFCFLLSTRAGGLGLNLQTADTVIIFDTDWNPHQDLQAQDRAHRIGQKNEVRILRLITEDSVEEMILERAHAKLEIDGKVIQAGKFDNKSTSEEQEALLRALIEKEEERKVKGHVSDDEDLDDDELNQVIARNDNELELFRKMDEERMITTRDAPYPSRLYTDPELPAIYRRDPEELLKKDEFVLEDYGRGNRERKTATYDDNLTEEQWLKKIEGVVSDSDDDRPKKRGRPKARRTKFDDNVDDLTDDYEAIANLKRPSMIDDDDDDLENLPEPISKRQRSATPKLGARGVKGRATRGKSRGKGSLLYRGTPTSDPLTPESRTKLQNVIETIYKLVMKYENEHGRRLSDLFLVKPSRKLYPDYYVLIHHPIALDTVKKRIFSMVYITPRELLEDLHLMFSNARIYNEEGSIVFQDATALEQMAVDKFRELSVDLSQEEVSRILDFKEFDDTLNLKPLAISAIKQPVEAKLRKLDNDEPIDSPLVGISTNADTENSTPATFD